MASTPRKSYVAKSLAQGSYVIVVSEGSLPDVIIPGFPTMDRALEECIRLKEIEDERVRRQGASDA